ncbi:MAG: transcription-repair coupling factor [Candidatus Zixiibacteriota bacterium]
MTSRTNNIVPTATPHLTRICELWQSHDGLCRLSEAIAKGEKKTVITGLAGSSISFLTKALAKNTGKSIVFITEKPDDAVDLYEDLLALLDESQICHYPARQILPFDFRAPIGEIMGQRIGTVSRMANSEAPIVVTSLRAILEPAIERSTLAEQSIRIKKGELVLLDDLTNRFVSLGFRRVPVVEEVGDFAVRGGLIDFFTPGSEAPVRVELYDIEVDTIRQFDVATQRTIALLPSVAMLPRREIPINLQSLEQYVARLSEDDADYIRRRYLNDPELPGLEWLATLFDLPRGSFWDYVPSDAIVITDEHTRLAEQGRTILEEANGARARLASHITQLPKSEDYYHSFESLERSLARHSVVETAPFRGGREDAIDFDCKPHPAFGSRIDILGHNLGEYDTLGLQYVIATDTSAQAERLTEILRERVPQLRTGAVEAVDVKAGFISTSGGFAVLTDHEIFSRYHRRIHRKKFKEGVAITDYAALNKFDYVVHTDYGIARYLGLETIVVDNRHRDCLLLQYAGTDKLFVPIEEFNRVGKYAGKDSIPELTVLGGTAWDKLKEKTKKAIADMAADLIHLYAERKRALGYSYGEDTVWMKQLEASFPYDETVDQLKAIEDVKRDMKDDQPMDRLICGDVGFGKTEVAIRAAFKAIESGKQVAVLVPTTVLAQQHYQTFSSRLADFPVRIEMLSRFRTTAQQKESVQALTDGKCELVIGTHRLLSKDVTFRDLGLLIIDEEHRFGVGHKEKLRQMKANVDTISMSATPIPRTLQMSLMGARDMSMIATSPKDRLPILTDIVEFDRSVIANALQREIDRGGQVFFVHNRVATIESMHRYLKALLPRIEIGVAHGQMHERALEGIMLAFLAGTFNVLLCTSIIESGLDIPNANTIIINRSDRFGLAQLYQLRGRVGRSSRRAYAYLLTPPTKYLSSDSLKRLHALEAHSDLGSGFALAMRDLEIRGAGTILGAKQSGYMEEVGFDLYNRLLEEAVAELRGVTLERPPDTTMELDLELYLNDDYVNDRQQKVDIYRRVADAKTMATIEAIREEVTDRFGRMPQSSVNLFDAAAVKVLASERMIEKVKLRKGLATVFFKEGRKLERREVEAIRKITDKPMEFSFVGRTQISVNLNSLGEFEHLAHLRAMLAAM